MRGPKQGMLNPADPATVVWRGFVQTTDWPQADREGDKTAKAMSQETCQSFVQGQLWPMCRKQILSTTEVVMLSATNTRTVAVSGSRSSRLMAAFFAALLGASLLYGIGFAQSEVLHNAAHDSRHAAGFPCH